MISFHTSVLATVVTGFAIAVQRCDSGRVTVPVDLLTSDALKSRVEAEVVTFARELFSSGHESISLEDFESGNDRWLENRDRLRLVFRRAFRLDWDSPYARMFRRVGVPSPNLMVQILVETARDALRSNENSWEKRLAARTSIGSSKRSVRQGLELYNVRLHTPTPDTETRTTRVFLIADTAKIGDFLSYPRDNEGLFVGNCYVPRVLCIEVDGRLVGVTCLRDADELFGRSGTRTHFALVSPHGYALTFDFEKVTR
ncbi:MAG: hypothetical protein KDC95_16135 [Planctomycetes bacterium]|nr:hypothetical protein [Planctomycetota bacterium]